MNYTALSLSQTPPLSVPLRFFLTAPLFIVAAALVVAFSGPELFATRWNPTVLALTHLVTLGFLGSSMIGALQQLLPVLVGVSLSAPVRTSAILHGLWTLGSALLVTGMGLDMSWALQAGALLVGLSLAILMPIAGLALWRSASRHATVPAMGLALAGLGAAFTLALVLLFRFDWQLPLAHPLSRLHIGWAAIGWIGLLVIGVAYQVVPMFQITPEYPRWIRRSLVPLLGAILVGWPLFYRAGVGDIGDLLVAAGLALFALTTLNLQRQRRRRLTDVTLDFWRFSMGSLLLAIPLWLATLFQPSSVLELLVGVLFLLGFAYSAINGMLYKIVPFLVWLHLNNRLQQSGQWQGRVPNMKQVIAERHARWQFRWHLLAMALLLLAIVYPVLPLPVVGLAWLVNGLWLGGNLWQALSLYRRVAAEQERG